MTAFVPGVMGAIAAIAGYSQACRTARGVALDLSEHEALLFNTRYNETYYSYTGMEIKRHGKSFAGWSCAAGLTCQTAGTARMGMCFVKTR